MNDRASRSLALLATTSVSLASVAHAQEASLSSFVEPTLKAGFRLTSPAALPSTSLGLVAAEEEPGEALCGAEYAGNAMPIGDRERYSGLLKGVGMGLLSRALSAASDGAIESGGGRRDRDANEPTVSEDPIDKKEATKIKDKESNVELRLGGEMASDSFLLSTRLEDARDKGTVHEIYLERDDCRRIYPFRDFTYELWGEWNLSVSWSKTSSTYQDGQLVDQQTSSGGFMRSGEGFLDAESSTRAFREALEEVPRELQRPLTRYHAQVQEEIGAPMWQRLGFVAPTSGARHVGNTFLLGPTDMQALRDGRFTLIVQVTSEGRRFYQVTGVPVAIGLGADNALTFAEIEREKD